MDYWVIILFAEKVFSRLDTREMNFRLTSFEGPEIPQEAVITYFLLTLLLFLFTKIIPFFFLMP